MSPSLVEIPQSGCKSQGRGCSWQTKRIKSVLGCCMCCTGGPGKGLGHSQGEFLLFGYPCKQQGDDINCAGHWSGHCVSLAYTPSLRM